MAFDRSFLLKVLVRLCGRCQTSMSMVQNRPRYPGPVARTRIIAVSRPGRMCSPWINNCSGAPGASRQFSRPHRIVRCRYVPAGVVDITHAALPSYLIVFRPGAAIPGDLANQVMSPDISRVTACSQMTDVVCFSSSPRPLEVDLRGSFIHIVRGDVGGIG